MKEFRKVAQGGTLRAFPKIPLPHPPASLGSPPLSSPHPSPQRPRRGGPNPPVQGGAGPWGSQLMANSKQLRLLGPARQLVRPRPSRPDLGRLPASWGLGLGPESSLADEEGTHGGTWGGRTEGREEDRDGRKGPRGSWAEGCQGIKTGSCGKRWGAGRQLHWGGVGQVWAQMELAAAAAAAGRNEVRAGMRTTPDPPNPEVDSNPRTARPNPAGVGESHSPRALRPPPPSLRPAGRWVLGPPPPGRVEPRPPQTTPTTSPAHERTVQPTPSFKTRPQKTQHWPRPSVKTTPTTPPARKDTVQSTPAFFRPRPQHKPHPLQTTPRRLEWW